MKVLKSGLKGPALVLLLGALLLHSLSSPAAPQVIPVDRIVAVVNNEVITEGELKDRLAMVTKQLQKQGTPLPPSDALKKQVLERMITDRIQLQYAKETGLRVDDAQLDRTLARIAEENHLTPGEFRAALERDGVDFNKFREEIRDEIIIARLRQREVDDKITVTDSEIDNYLKTEETQGGRVEEYKIAHILIRVPEQATSDQIQAKRERAEEALAKLKGGADFAQVAAVYSDAPDALQGGLLDWRPAGRLPEIFVQALSSMNPGDVSPVLRSPAGFHIIKLVAERGKNVAEVVTQTHVRHILIKTSELVSDADAKKRLLQIKERIEHGEDFAALAQRYSEDTSAAKGGDLGWVSPGDTVPEFERAMDKLKVGQVSDPVHTPFGWHLIQVLGRRAKDVSKERERLLAAQAVRARKADEAYQEWLRQLRDRAYVEYRLEDK